MKRILNLLLICLLLTNCQNLQKSEKSEKAKESENFEYKASLENGNLNIFGADGKTFGQINISANSENRLIQKNKGDFFFVAFYEDYEVVPDFLGLINTADKKWIIKVNPNESKDYLIANAEFIGACHHNRYLLFEGGTDASIREIRVITNDGVLNHSDYYSTFKIPEWHESGMSFEYYKIEDNYPDSLPEFTGNNNSWVKKHIWKKGSVTATNEFEQTYSQ